MKIRTWSIRSKIIALVAVPLSALLALWIFATVLTGRTPGVTWADAATAGLPVTRDDRAAQEDDRAAQETAAQDAVAQEQASDESVPDHPANRSTQPDKDV